MPNQQIAPSTNGKTTFKSDERDISSDVSTSSLFLKALPAYAGSVEELMTLQHAVQNRSSYHPPMTHAANALDLLIKIAKNKEGTGASAFNEVNRLFLTMSREEFQETSRSIPALQTRLNEAFNSESTALIADSTGRCRKAFMSYP